MAGERCFDAPRWYAIHTKPKQEFRADSNLKGWSVETFAPRLKERRYNEYTLAGSYVVEPFFRNYIFARFKVSEMLHKIRFTRGVRAVVSFGGVAAPIDDEIIDFIQSRTENGFVKLDEDLKAGDEVVVEGGAFKGLSGIFDRETTPSGRVLILLRSVNYQACIEMDRVMVKKCRD